MYRNRCNILLDSFKAPRHPGTEKGVLNYEDDFLQAHSFSRLIPPGVKNRNSYIQNAALDFVKDKKYFVTNPEWFSMDESGKRVPDRQLCFTNAELKKELEKNYNEEFITAVTDVVKVESMQSTSTIIIAVVVYVVFCLVLGSICSDMAEKCGLEGNSAFAKGFFLGIIGVALCAKDCIEAMTYQINILKAEKEK